MRAKNTECIISLASLKNGEHSFLFTLDRELFSENNMDEIHHADLKVLITFNKNSPILMFTFAIEGVLTVACDRCGDDLDLTLKLERRLIIKTEGKEHSEEDGMVTLSTGEKDIDIAPYIYQYVVLSLPMQRIHPVNKEGNSGCNPEALKKLKKIEVKKSNEELYIIRKGATHGTNNN